VSYGADKVEHQEVMIIPEGLVFRADVDGFDDLAEFWGSVLD